MSDEVAYTLNIHEEDGEFWGQFEELPGCFAAGATIDELLESAEEALELYLRETDVPTPAAPVVPITSRTRRRHTSVRSAEILLQA